MDEPAENVTEVHLLLVEGREEKRFFEALLANRERNDIQVMAYEGKTNLANKFRALRLDSGFDRVRWLGITRDADENAEDAFRSVSGALSQVPLPTPSRSWEATGTSPAVVAFILPDGASRGDLETLVLQAVDNQPRMQCVNVYFDCLRNIGSPVPRQVSKARIHAYLASLNPPERRLGDAAADGLLPLDSPAFDRFLDLLPASA